MMLIGYERVSTDDQNLALQHDALQAAGYEKFFRRMVQLSGAVTHSAELNHTPRSARRTLSGGEAMNMIRKGQVKGVRPVDSVSQVRFIESIL